MEENVLQKDAECNHGCNHQCNPCCYDPTHQIFVKEKKGNQGIYPSLPAIRIRMVYTHKIHTLWASALLSCLHLAKACANCSFGAICDIQTEQCVCVSECVESNQPVCGSDGITYNSECELNVRACEKKMDLRVVSQGECSKWCMHAHVALCTSSVLKDRRGAEKDPRQTQTIDRGTKRKKVKSSFFSFFCPAPN